jgi:acyl-CoA thioester hydrolase
MKKYLIDYTTEYRVIYAHTDPMGIVNNSRYLEYFEVGRTELIRSMGISYKQVEEHGIMLPLIETHLEFIKPAKYDDILKIRSFILEMPVIKMKINYEISAHDELLCKGFTTHAFVKSSNFHPTRLPDFFRKILSGEKNVK